MGKGLVGKTYEKQLSALGWLGPKKRRPRGGLMVALLPTLIEFSHT